MNTTLLGENTISLFGSFVQNGQKAPDFTLVGQDLKTRSLKDYAGKTVILNIFPSIDTSTCATSVRKFNERAASLENVEVICVSRDLPFAQKRFCGAEGIENVSTLSDFRDGSFGRDYGVEMQDGVLQGLHARAVVVISPRGEVVYSEMVPSISSEPDYESALTAAQ